MAVPDALSTRLRTALCVAFLPMVVIAYSSLALGMAALGMTAPTLHWAYLSFCRVCLRSAGTRVEVRGSSHIRPGQAYVIVSNHTSSWDIPCIVAGLQELVVRFVVKHEIMQIPIFGHALRATGNVRVLRAETSGDIERIHEQMDQRDPAVSLLFFAEGTRTPDGSMRPFKMGAFATALGYRLSILPVAIAGPYTMWPKGRLRFHPCHAAIEVGEPIPVEGLDFDDRSALRDQAHQSVVKLRASARQRLRDQGHDPGGMD